MCCQTKQRNTLRSLCVCLMHSVHCSKRVCQLYICLKYDVLLVCVSVQRLFINTKENHVIVYYLADVFMTHMLLFLHSVQSDHLRFEELKTEKHKLQPVDCRVQFFCSKCGKRENCHLSIQTFIRKYFFLYTSLYVLVFVE